VDGVGWTLETLHAHFAALMAEADLRYQQRYDSQTKAWDAAFLAASHAVETALTAAEKAVTKAETAAEKRFESVNEFRDTLSDQASQFLTRTEAESSMSNLRERVQELTDRINRSEGRGAGLNASYVYVIAAIGAVGTIVAVYLALKR
jgi:small-conductance mechanosensitive channel